MSVPVTHFIVVAVVVAVVIGHITGFESFGNCFSEDEAVKPLKKLCRRKHVELLFREQFLPMLRVFSLQYH